MANNGLEMTLLNQILHFSGRSSWKSFQKDLCRPQHRQNQVLREMMLSLQKTGYGKSRGYEKVTDYSSFKSRIPMATYENYEDAILKQMNGEDDFISPHNLRFIPTSGSTSSRKWIPFNSAQKKAFDAASTPWLHDMTKQFPELKNGCQYWSLSWLPNELRTQGNIADDLELFPAWKKWMWQRLMAAPSSLAFTDDSEKALIATCAYLCARPDLTMLSVWSPTFATCLLRKIKENWSLILDIFESKSWPWPMPKTAYVPKVSASRLKLLHCIPKNQVDQKTHLIWPNLSLLSAWDSNSSKTAAEALKTQFNGIPLQGKGLWATEGVLTIPFLKQMPVAIRSHFYEFRNLDDDQILLLDQLQEGMSIQPILSCGNGLLRYQLDDVLYVQKPLAETPCLTFQGRAQTIDLCGEKLTPQLVEAQLNELDLGQWTLFACKGDNPRYHLHSERHCDADLIDTKLKEIYHYAVARELSQLSRLSSSVGSTETWDSLIEKKDSIQGAVKVEALKLWNKEQDPNDFFQTSAISKPNRDMRASVSSKNNGEVSL